MLFKWFLGLRIDERGFDASTLSKNRQRLLDHEIADRFFAAVVDQARLRRYCSSEHFSVDGTLLKPERNSPRLHHSKQNTSLGRGFLGL